MLSPHDSKSEYFPTQTPAESLFHRRQRSNTAPSSAPSPLSALSSSLGHWNGAVTATAAATAGLPSFTVTSADEASTTPTTSSLPMTSSPLTDGTVPYGEFFSSQRRGSVDSTCSLGFSGLEIDMDRTPRRSDFPRNVQEQYPSQLSNMSSGPEFSSSMEQPVPMSTQGDYDLRAYVAGLHDLDISIPYELASASHSMSPFEELDFSEFLCPGNY